MADTGIYCVCDEKQKASQFVFRLHLAACVCVCVCAEVTIQCHKLAFVELFVYETIRIRLLLLM